MASINCKYKQTKNKEVTCRTSDKPPPQAVRPGFVLDKSLKLDKEIMEMLPVSVSTITHTLTHKDRDSRELMQSTSVNWTRSCCES